MPQSDKYIVEQLFKANPDLRKTFKDEVLSSSATTKANNRHADSRSAKALARSIASNSWREDENETIQDVAEYIHAILAEDGHEYMLDTVKSWIKDLAPANMRKPGRPTKRS